MNGWPNTVIFGWYPYLALTVFVIGGWLRFGGEPHVRSDGSGRIWNYRSLTWGVVLFHAGILILFAGHLIGLLTPIEVFEGVGISHAFKQSMANVVGGTAGAIALAGLLLILRRSRDKPDGSKAAIADTAILLLILIQLGLGLATIPVAVVDYASGCGALPFMWWAQNIAMLKPSAAAGYTNAMPLLFKLHIINGMTIALIFPFTRLVNVWSVPRHLLDRLYCKGLYRLDRAV